MTKTSKAQQYRTARENCDGEWQVERTVYDSFEKAQDALNYEVRWDIAQTPTPCTNHRVTTLPDVTVEHVYYFSSANVFFTARYRILVPTSIY